MGQRLTQPKAPQQKKAEANLENLRRIFTLPEYADATLNRIDREISRNLMGFLSEHIVTEETAPHRLERDFLETQIPDDPTFVSEQVDFLMDKVVAQSVHTASPSFVGHMTSAVPYFMLPLAKIMTALNQNLVKIETSKAFTPLERQVVGMLHRLVYGRDDTYYAEHTQSATACLGVFCSGGTIANIASLWLARNRILGEDGDFAGIRETGFARALAHYGYKDVAILVSKRGHYSLSKAADLLGLGRQNLVSVPIRPDHKMDVDALRQKMADLKAEGIAPMAVVGIAGTTETGHVDPLADIADACAEFGAHFHVDAAWGGPTLFSNKHRELLDGIERADSVTMDAHKQLYVPMGAGVALFRDERAADAVRLHAQYIIRRGSRDIGKYTLEGSRAGMAMLVHSALKVFGRRGFEILIDIGIGKARQFARQIYGLDDFELITSPELNLLTYRYVPAQLLKLMPELEAETRTRVNEVLSELTAQIQKTQRAAGKTFVSRTRLEGAAHDGQILTVFRVVLANPLTTRAILTNMLVEQRQHGEQILREQGFADKLMTILADDPAGATLSSLTEGQSV